jgi:branched-chain amino acid transport system permease protein
VLFSIGLVYVSIAVATYFFGPSQQTGRTARVPSRFQIDVAGRGFGAYRLSLIGVVAVLTVGPHLLMDRTRFGAMVPARIPGWNYTLRLYRSRAEILSSKSTFPEATPMA